MLKISLTHLFWLEGRILWIVKWWWWAAGNSEDKDRPQSSWDVPHSFLGQHSFLCQPYLSSAGHILSHLYSYGAVIYTRKPLLTNLPLQLACHIQSGKMEMLNKLLLCVCICMYRCVWTHMFAYVCAEKIKILGVLSFLFWDRVSHWPRSHQVG